MKNLPLLLILFLAGCSGQAFYEADMTKSFSGRSIRNANYRTPKSLSDYVERLMSERRNWRQHGIYIESLNGGEPVAMLNENAEFNPASVIKLATTLAALDKLGLNYRFRTEFRASGALHAQTGELQGDLILLSGGDPSFSLNDAQQVGEVLRQSGIRSVNGSLVVVGTFTCKENPSTQGSAEVFRKESKIFFRQPTRFESFGKYLPRGRSLLTVESGQLLSIVQYLNAHSVNAMAEMLGSHIGGPQGVQKFLVERIGMPQKSVYISQASGLQANRMTPRDTVMMLRAMIKWLSAKQLKPSAVMAIAGIDAGTLRGRFTEGKFAGSVVAKTGTLLTTDSGVAALAGIIYTRNRGPLLFAIYDVADGGKVPPLRRAQDEFLKDVVMESGGPLSAAKQDGRISFTAHPQSRIMKGI